MPRRNRPKGLDARAPAPVGPSLGWGSRESGPDGDWMVRSVPGSAATKTYRCPGCDQEIRPGTPHVVAWPADETGSITDRRHWHRACWDARQRRRPTGR